jgi:hypothetical protein
MLLSRLNDAVLEWEVLFLDNQLEFLEFGFYLWCPLATFFLGLGLGLVKGTVVALYWWLIGHG